MRGINCNEDLRIALIEEQQIKEIIEKQLNIKLEKSKEYIGDFYNVKNNRLYEFKKDPLLGKSGNFMIELFADWNPDTIELGWWFRYKELHVLVYYNDNIIRLYDY